MSRLLNCKTCGSKHSPPTGRRCTKSANINSNNPDLSSVLGSLTSTLDTLSKRLDKLEGQHNEVIPPQQDADSNADADEAATSATLDTLKQDAGLAEKVQKRLAELDLPGPSTGNTAATNNSKGKTSGATKTADDLHVRRDILWPHFYIHRGPERRPARYEELSLPEFVYGFLCMLDDSPEPAPVKSLMLAKLRDVMRDALDFDWLPIRNYVRIILQEIEREKISWSDQTAMQELRVLYLHRISCENVIGKPAGQRKPVLLSCLPFQQDKCAYTSDHNSARGPVRHVCGFCLKITGNGYPHPEKECRRKDRLQSKKDQDTPPEPQK